jgi:hypothetical protein
MQKLATYLLVMALMQMEIQIKMQKILKRNASNADFKTKFFEEFPKGTALKFKDKESEYEIILDDLNVAKKYIANWEKRAAVSKQLKE